MKVAVGKGTAIDLVNIGLILVALALAYLMPFSAFLVAYAVLGPLHYLTEINWLHGRSYFAGSKFQWVAIAIISVLVISLPKIASYAGLIASGMFSETMWFLDSMSNPILILAFWSAMVLTLTEKGWLRNMGCMIGLVFFVLANLFPSNVVMVGAMLPTIIHVYVFTALFMVFGATKNKSVIGFLTAGLVLAVPIFISIADVDKNLYVISDWTKDTFVLSNFHLLNLDLAKLFGLADGTSFFFYGSWELKMQRFIAFAYIYHYLNWFSKTAIIGWHKGLSGGRVWIVLILWSGLVCLFWIDYQLGFYSVLSLSFLHVVLEFPLNAISAKGIVVWVSEKLR